MSDNKLVKTILDAATLTGIAAGLGWIAKKVAKENFTPDPSSNVINYVKFTGVNGCQHRGEKVSRRTKDSS